MLKSILNHTRVQHALLQLPLVLALHAVPDGVEHIVNGSLGLEARLGALLVDTSLDKYRVPVCLVGMLVVFVGSPNVRLGSVADKVHSRGWRVDAVRVFAPSLKQACGKLKSANLGLAVGSCLELLTSDSLVHGLERHTQSPHADSGEVVRSTPDDVVVREEHWRPLVKVLRSRTETTVLRHQQVKDDLLVRGPVARVGKDKDGLNLDFGKVAGSRVFVLFSRQRAEGRRVLVVLDDITRRDAVFGSVTVASDRVPGINLHVFETVPLGNDAALFALAANNQDCPILLCHLAHGCMPADELTWGNLDFELLAQLDTALSLGFAATVCDEDVGHFDAILVLTVEHLHCLNRFRDWSAAPDEHTIDVECERILVGDCRFKRGRAGR
jgi:hypothetical protein